jgi:hypothetical protein
MIMSHVYAKGGIRMALFFTGIRTGVMTLVV